MKAPFQLFIALAVLLATATVAAQVYKWVDKDGKVQYSDTPPPASATKTEAKKVETGPAVANLPAPAGKSLADRSKDYDKRQKDAVEAGKKADEAKKNADLLAENCKIAQSAARDLESGRPMKRINDQGESVYVNDEERAAELAKAKAAAAAACKA